MDDESLWRDSAACRGVDPELFFPLTEFGPSLVQIAQAKQTCRVCQVRPDLSDVGAGACYERGHLGRQHRGRAEGDCSRSELSEPTLAAGAPFAVRR
jgi:WhiB family transcriptional regulator, redox-sensing transcriptional regulator